MPNKHPPADLSLFLASAAHDMKNSVGMLSATLEGLLKDPALREAPAFRALAHMLYETRRMNDNLIQLLALYKELGHSAYPYDPQANEVGQFAIEVLEQNQVLLDAKHIALDIDCPEQLVWIFDEYLVLGVVNHAINNAIHYTHDRIDLSFAVCDGILEIRVADNGAGYPEAMLAASHAVRSGVNFSTGSTGLGLYFSSEVARMHTHKGKCGSVTLENHDNGACFVLRLP